MKKIFENAIWWSGVVMVGLVLGVSLQFVRAWTEPTEAPPGGNVGAPINTGPLVQVKEGGLGINGLLSAFALQVPAGVVSGTPQAGSVLTAKETSPGVFDGQVAWAPGGGGVSHGTSVTEQSFPADGVYRKANNLSARINTSGKPVFILASLVYESDDWGGSETNIRIIRDGNPLGKDCGSYFDFLGGRDFLAKVDCFDTPPAGEHIYEVEIKEVYAPPKINQAVDASRDSCSRITAFEL